MNEIDAQALMDQDPDVLWAIWQQSRPAGADAFIRARVMRGITHPGYPALCATCDKYQDKAQDGVVHSTGR